MGKISVYTLGWNGDHAIEDGEDPKAQLHGRVFVDGVEIECASGITVRTCGGDFVTADIHVSPTSVEILPVDKEAFASPNPAET